MNLYERIEDMYKNGCGGWNYYDRNMIRPFNCAAAEEFIKQYFSFAAKKYVVSPVIDHMNQKRIMHTVSAFFIGSMLKLHMGQNLDIRSCDSQDYEFSYLWFLVCLYHDMGYAIEEDWTYKFSYRERSKKFLRENKTVRRIWKRGSVYEDLGIVFVLPQRYKSNSNVELDREPYMRKWEGIEFGNNVRIKRAMYSRRTILDYLEYCKMADNIRHYDHGIVGGFWLYDSLMQNYYNMYSRETSHCPNIAFNDFEVDGSLHFFMEQRMVFAYLADCIISHNIWPASKEETYETYQKCGLDELVGSKFKKIAFNENPMLFILAIADTIEPIKLYFTEKKGISETDIWKGIDLLFEKDRVTIKVLDTRLSFESLERKVNGLDNWLDVTWSSHEDDRTIEIVYNHVN